MKLRKEHLILYPELSWEVRLHPLVILHLLGHWLWEVGAQTILWYIHFLGLFPHNAMYRVTETTDSSGVYMSFLRGWQG